MDDERIGRLEEAIRRLADAITLLDDNRADGQAGSWVEARTAVAEARRLVDVPT